MYTVQRKGRKWAIEIYEIIRGVGERERERKKDREGEREREFERESLREKDRARKR